MPLGHIIGTIAGVGYTLLQRTFVVAGVERGMSANAIYRAMRGTELGMRRQAVLALVREVRGAKEAANRIKFVRRDARISERLMQPASSELPSRYRFHGVIRGRSAVTGEEKEVFVTVRSDKLLTRGEVEDLIRQGGDKSVKSQELQNIKLEITAAYRRGEE